MSRSVNPLLLFMSGGFPHLKLTVKRENIIEDALTHLEMVGVYDMRKYRFLFYFPLERMNKWRV